MKLAKIRSQKFRRGSLLAFVLVIGVCLALLGFGMLELGFGSRLRSAISVFNMKAREAADAGIAKALYEMNLAFHTGTAWTSDPGPVTLANSNAIYDYRIDPNGPNYIITSKGTSVREQRIVYALAELTSKYDFGLLVTDEITLKEGSLIDAYDSTKGFYGDDNSKQYVRIGTTSLAPKQINLNNKVTIMGDVLVGVGGDPDVVINETPLGGATVGARYPMPYEFEWDIKTPPVGLLAGEPIVFKADANFPLFPKGVATITRSGAYGSVTLTQGQLLRIESNAVPKLPVTLWITNDTGDTGKLTLGQGAELRIEGDPFMMNTWTPVTIYLDGNLDGSNSNGINNMTMKPLNFFLYGTGDDQEWRLKNGTAFYGVYYGRNADIYIDSKNSIYGSITGRSFDLNNSGGGAELNWGLHYDQSLSDPLVAPEGYAIMRWWEDAATPLVGP